MKVSIVEFDNSTHFTIGDGQDSQNTCFEIGQLYQKVSKNVSFNEGEILECVNIIDNIAYFTCERLKSIHENRFLQKESITKGIPLEKGEEIVLLTDNILKRKELENNIQSSKKALNKIQTLFKDTDYKIKQLQRNKKELLNQKEIKKQDIEEMEKQLKSLK